MNTSPEEQVWAVAEAIANGYEIAPSNGTILLGLQQFAKAVSEVELKQILNRLELDEKVITITRRPDDLILGEERDCYGISIPDQEKFREFLNKAHSRHYGDVNKLAAENFFAVCDVAMDICAELQLANGTEVCIPLMRNIVRFPALMPADGINMRDAYCDYRWKALEYLRDREHIRSFELENDMYGHRWESKVLIATDRYSFDKFYKKLIDAYERRVVEPNRKATKSVSPRKERANASSTPLVQKIEITKMPDLRMHNADDAPPIVKGKKRIHLPKFTATDWASVNIRFFDERNVFITAGKKQVPSDYEALGFSDGKRDKPNTAWAFLLTLARNKGETNELPTPIPDTVKQQKRQLADRLKTIFKNDTDPFYDPADTRTYKLKIALTTPPIDGVPQDTLGIDEYLKETMIEE